MLLKAGISVVFVMIVATNLAGEHHGACGSKNDRAA